MINASGTIERPSVHQPWCDPAQHALSASAFLDDRGNFLDTGCVGAAIEPSGPDQLGGWWHQDRDGRPEFLIDRGIDVPAFGAGAIRQLDELLSTPEGTQQLRRLARGAVSALEGTAK